MEQAPQSSPHETRGRDAATLEAFCRGILFRGDLASKLRAPPPHLPDPPFAPVRVEQPARDAALSLRAGVERLPRPPALRDPQARARVLARFAHHELMAVELFAWALLRWPDLPATSRRELLSVLRDEQRHCSLYLERLAAHGSHLTEHPRSDYFWKHAGSIGDSPHGPRAFLCAMGLTLEQANLDHASLYRDGFRDAGDDATARVCDAVHRDEVRHVRVARRILLRLSQPGRGDAEVYAACVPFPFAPTRAKGRRFDAEARRRAGLSEDFITLVRDARSPVRPPRAARGPRDA